MRLACAQSYNEAHLSERIIIRQIIRCIVFKRASTKRKEGKYIMKQNKADIQTT